LTYFDEVASDNKRSESLMKEHTTSVGPVILKEWFVFLSLHRILLLKPIAQILRGLYTYREGNSTQIFRKQHFGWF